MHNITRKRHVVYQMCFMGNKLKNVYCVLCIKYRCRNEYVGYGRPVAPRKIVYETFANKYTRNYTAIRNNVVIGIQFL